MRPRADAGCVAFEFNRAGDSTIVAEMRSRHEGGVRHFLGAGSAALALACSGAPVATSVPPDLGTTARASTAKPPDTPKRPVIDRYHDVAVTDEYRWLEASAAPEVQSWVASQNRYTRSVLDALPGRAAIREQVQAVFAAEHPRYRWIEAVPGRWFVKTHRPPAQQPVILSLEPGAEPTTATVLIDPNRIDATGQTAIDWFVPSPDGALLAVSLSRAGTELGDVSVYRVADGAKLEDTVTRVNGGTAGGDLAWAPDGSGFYYTRYPRAGERAPADLAFHQQVYFHALGTPENDDRYEIGRDFPRIAENQLEVDDTGRVLLTVQNGDGGEFAHYLRDEQGRWRQFSRFGDPLVQAAFLPNTRDLIAITRARSPAGEVVRIDAGTLDPNAARTIVPASEHPLVTDFWGDRTLLVTDRELYLTYQLGGPTVVRRFDHTGTPLPLELPLPVASFVGLSRDGTGKVLMQAESFLEPPAWYRLHEDGKSFSKTALADRAPFDTAAFQTLREFAISKDGTRIPLNILAPKDVKRDGARACVATGYGGYGISLEPHFRPGSVLWLERGVLFVVANLRGGSEFGTAWHRAGNLTKKQNVFDDFAAVLQHLVERGYTTPERLGIIGRSNGGLLMGATLVQHPGLVGAAVSSVGIYDMLRVELSPNGAFNITEFGTVTDREQFRALYGYSPYHNVRDGVRYPPVLMLAGDNDPRVEPMQSRKMIARLQAANGGGGPILLRTDAATGHGGDSSLDARISEQVDVQAFMLDALGVPVEPRAGASRH